MLQHMQYNTDNDGPCYMSTNKQQNRRLDKHLGNSKEKNLNKFKLVALLKETSVSNLFGTKKELQEECSSRGISVIKITDKILEGWMGKQKGTIQILFKRGRLDPQNIHHYTEKGTKEKFQVPRTLTDPTGCDFSIWKILALQSNFINELTLLQFHGQKLGVVVDRSPKCHPKIAREGIVYLWALAKLWYRKAPITKKRSKESFRKLVVDATDCERGIKCS